jgi:hypothetical protein
MEEKITMELSTLKIRLLIRILVLAAATASIGWSLMPLHAATWLSAINNADDNDELVVINAATGIVKLIGPVGSNLIQPDLAIKSGRLFALDKSALAGPGTHVDLIDLSRSTGQELSRQQITAPHGIPEVAEGLAAINNQLVLAYRRADFMFAGESNTLGDLALNGIVSNPTPFPQSTDFDALAVNAAELFYSLDVDTGATHLFTASRTPPLLNTITSYNSEGLRGLDFNRAGELFVVDSGLGLNSSKVLHQVNPGTGAVIATVSYGAQYELLSLAAVPEPSAIALVALAVLGVASTIRPQRT